MGLNAMFQDTSYKEISYEFKDADVKQSIYAL